jgi:hypothetical protein
VYLLKHILHDWSDDACVTILENCAANMARDGRVLVIEYLVTPGAPSFATLLDLEMLVGTDGGRERTELEFAALFARAGLRLTRCIPTSVALAIVEAVVV